MSVFVKLKTEYSISKSTITVKEGIKIAKKLGYSAVLLADDGNLFGALDFSLEAVKNKIFPIIGVCVSFEFEGIERKITLIAKTQEGFSSLLHLTFEKVSLERIKQFNKDVIILSKITEKNLLYQLSSIFSKENFYIEISRLSNEKEEMAQEQSLLNLALELDVPIIYSNDAYFQNAEMFEPQDVLTCIGAGKFLLEEQRESASRNNYFKS